MNLHVLLGGFMDLTMGEQLTSPSSVLGALVISIILKKELYGNYSSFLDELSER